MKNEICRILNEMEQRADTIVGQKKRHTSHSVDSPQIGDTVFIMGWQIGNG
jgi:hypothetical protein